MVSIDPSSISDTRREKWVDEISKIFHHSNVNVLETPCVSIFRVPKTITTPKPEAYEPQQLGLGPNHHFCPQLYVKMEQKKLAAMRRVLQNHSTKDFELLVLDKVRKLVPVVRECYDMFLQDDDDFLAWVFAIDGLFLLDLFNSYKKGDQHDQLPPTLKKIAFHEEVLHSNHLPWPRIGHQTENTVMSENQYKEIESDDVASIIAHHTETRATSGNQTEEIMGSDDIVKTGQVLDSDDLSLPLIGRRIEKVVVSESHTEEILESDVTHSMLGRQTEVAATWDNLIEEITKSDDMAMDLNNLPSLEGEIEHSSPGFKKISNADDIAMDPNNVRTIHGPIEASNALVYGVTAISRPTYIVDLNDVHALVDGETELSSPSKRSEVDPERRLLAQDIMMLENQIPFMVLKEIDEALHPSSGHSFHSQRNFSPSVFRSFSEIHSPLVVCSPSQAPAHVEHLLNYLYHSIANNVPAHIEYDEYVEVTISKSAPMPETARLPRLLVNSTNFVKAIPRDEIVQIYGQTITILETFSQSKTVIPSASELHKRAGFRFHRLPKDQGIKKIHIEGKKFYLPCLTLNSDSEVILRNLVAYETTSKVHSNNFPLTEYVVLMCGLIVNANDVKLLQEENIINGGLQVNEVVKLFCAMKSSIPRITAKERSYLQVTIEEVNEDYESRLSMKMFLLLKKMANWLLVFLRALGSFVDVSWKIVAFLVSIVSVFILVWQAYYDAYGCDKAKDTLLTFASR